MEVFFSHKIISNKSKPKIKMHGILQSDIPLHDIYI